MRIKSLITYLLFSGLVIPAFATFSSGKTMEQGKAAFEVAFSPKRGATDLVIKAILEARKSIRLAAYSFTSKPIAEALIAARKRGIDVKVVLDKSQRKESYTSATFLANMGVPTRINSRYAIMHNKFIVIDGVNVELGSFNYTKSAEERNAENVLVIRNHPELAGEYSRYWQKLWDESDPYEAKY